MFEYNKDITHLTTFGIPVITKLFAEYKSIDELLKISRTDEYINNNVFHIGGGSNLLFMHDYDGLILHSRIKGITRYNKNSKEVYIIAGAGERWCDVVQFALDNNVGGLENLAGIPGEVGAAAVQNIGAYGAEVSDIIHKVECFDTSTRTIVEFSNKECKFAYRDSIFKNKCKGRYYVIRVAFKVFNDIEAHNIQYAPLKLLAENLGRVPTIHEVAAEVIKIRNSKLPDPKIIGNAGSFFKNPEIRKRYHQELEELSGIKIPYHPLPATDKDKPEMVKLNAAWLIDKAGLKGTRVGGAVVYPSQPLVIANDADATAEDVSKLADIVEREVRRKFFIHLFPEVNYIDTRIKVTILGSGTSKGIPEVGCLCETCTSSNPYDKRMRASVLVETNGFRILIDSSPDFKEQAVRAGITDIDAVLITHSHYDHVGGIDDLRPFCAQKNIPMYVREDVDKDLRKRVDYCFYTNHYPGVPSFDMNIIENKPFYINGLRIIPIEVLHGKKPIYGFRIGNFAYITDAKIIPEEEMDKLYDLDTLILNSLRDREHFAHLTVSQALNIIKILQPKKAVLTHFCHEIGPHALIKSRLPHNVYPAYDGMKLIID